jgi:hypoxanthine phosphoribosyltransferase
MTETARIEPLFTPEQIEARIQELAMEIIALRPEAREAEGLLMVGPLKGAVVFMSDLARALSELGIRVDLSFMKLSSYGAGTKSSGTVVLGHDIDMEVAGRHVLLVDDIIDTGRTIAFAQDYLTARSPQSVTTVLLLDKPSRRVVDAPYDLAGFVIEDLFVLGFGTDLNQRYRELPFIGVRISDEGSS